MFDALDATADGFLDRDDFTQRANQMCAALAPDERSQHHQDLQRAYRQAWEQLRIRADADDDGRLTREEYVTAVEKGILQDPQYIEDAVLVVSRALFRASDQDGDDVLSREEYVKMFTAIDMDGDMAAAGFDHIDRDGDGTISYSEFIEALDGVFSSSDPSSLGANVFG
ncbi:MAG: EF-hand domain-containing protein [Actinomycetota bacterium]|nr:EF-hand domain-containing protein [Actinomycetota bacterium]